MDYSVGSVADIISGSSTPNKPKVIKKKFKPKTPTPQKEEDDNEVKPPKKRSFSLRIKQEPTADDSNDEINQSDNEEEENEEENTIRNGNPKKKLKKTKSLKVKKQQKLIESPLDTEDDSDASSDGIKKEPEDTIEEEVKNPDHTTIFVGNLPITMSHKKLLKMFSKYGKVINARIRSIPVADPKIPKRIAAIKKQFHPERKSVHGYVTFATAADAEKALTLNGSEYKEHHIRVNVCNQKQTPDKSRAIFLGNVSFAAEEEELWKLFQSCGEIESVRLVRDRFTDIGKGFGYINFKSSDSVELALQMGEVKLRDRVLRVSLYNGKAPKKAKIQRKQNNVKPTKKGEEGEEDDSKATISKHGQFQGRFAAEKKKKFNKWNQQKKNLAKKIAPKPMLG